MNETYVEWLVKRKTPAYMTLLKILTIMLTVCFVLLGFFLLPAMIIAVLLGVAAYFVYLNSDVEYEYLYVDKELTVDKVMAKSRRKRVATYDLGKIEILIRTERIRRWITAPGKKSSRIGVLHSSMTESRGY